MLECAALGAPCCVIVTVTLEDVLVVLTNFHWPDGEIPELCPRTTALEANSNVRRDAVTSLGDVVWDV